MRINSIPHINFGYSKKNQKFLEGKAGLLQDRATSDTIILYSQLANKMEDEIREIERQERQNKAFLSSSFEDFYVDLRSALYRIVATSFDTKSGMKYLKDEYKYYENNTKRRVDLSDYDWRYSLMDTITEWIPSIAYEEKEMDDIDAKEIAPPIPQNEAQGATESQKAQILVEQLKPTSYSPKSFKDISGMDELKAMLQDDVIEPLKNPSQAELDYLDYGKELPMGILLYGPPGCGKTYIIEALAAEMGSNVYLMNVANIGSKFVNQSSINIKKSFDFLEKKAKDADKPIVVFLDEIDGLCSDRTEVNGTEHIKDVSTLLQCIESAQKHNVIVIGASNKYDIIDPAIRRRFRLKHFVGLPNTKQREEMLRMNLSKKRKAQKLLQDDRAIKELANLLEGYSYHSINIISDNASLNSLKRQRSDISFEDFKKAIDETQEEKINEAEYKSITSKNTIGFH